MDITFLPFLVVVKYLESVILLAVNSRLPAQCLKSEEKKMIIRMWHIIILTLKTKNYTHDINANPTSREPVATAGIEPGIS